MARGNGMSEEGSRRVYVPQLMCCRSFEGMQRCCDAGCCTRYQEAGPGDGALQDKDVYRCFSGERIQCGSMNVSGCMYWLRL